VSLWMKLRDTQDVETARPSDSASTVQSLPLCPDGSPQIPTDVDAALQQVATYMKDETDDWMTIKRIMLLILPFRHRLLFSTRDPVTKEQSLNAFERKLIVKWHEITGRELLLVKTRLGAGRQ
jgi:hypothetical protein